MCIPSCANSAVIPDRMSFVHEIIYHLRRRGMCRRRRRRPRYH